MLYDAARAEIRSGDLLAWRGTSFLGRLVRAVTGGSWSHVGIAWWYRGRLLVLEAKEGRGVSIRNASHALPFDHVSTGLSWTAAAEDRTFAELGMPYSWLDALRAGLGLRTNPADGFICSEFAAHVLAACDNGKSTVPLMPTPARLVEHFLEHGGRLVAVTAGRRVL